MFVVLDRLQTSGISLILFLVLQLVRNYTIDTVSDVIQHVATVVLQDTLFSPGRAFVSLTNKISMCVLICLCVCVRKYKQT